MAPHLTTLNFPYTCAHSAMVLGGGGTLPCTSCWSRRVFSIRDSVALLRLRANSNLNHRQGTVVGSRHDWYRVLLVGKNKLIAVRLVNLRKIYTAVFSPPGSRDKPQEPRENSGASAANVVVFEPQEQRRSSGPSTANVVMFEPPDVQIRGAWYKSTACSVVLSARMEVKTEKTAEINGQTYVSMKGARYESHPCSVVLSAGTDNKPLEVAGADGQADRGRRPEQWICLLGKTVEAAGVDGQTDRGWLLQQSKSNTDQLEQECTCCRGCKGTADQLCERWACKGKLPLCFKCNVGVKTAAAADAKKPHCTDEACF